MSPRQPPVTPAMSYFQPLTTRRKPKPPTADFDPEHPFGAPEPRSDEDEAWEARFAQERDECEEWQGRCE